MTPDRAAIAALTAALHAHRGQPLTHEQTAALAVTTLQGLGWRAPQLTVYGLTYSEPLTAPEGYDVLAAALDRAQEQP